MCTSSSSSSVPQGPWGKTWALALLCALIPLIALERFWRAEGHRPSITPTPALWSYQRDRLRGAGRDVVALLGGSRMQMGFDTEAFLEDHPSYTVVQLAIAGTGPFVSLRDLATDSSFRGLVVCAVNAQALQPTYFASQQGYVDYYQQLWGPGKRIDIHASTFLEDRFALFQQYVVGRPLLAALVNGRLPSVNFVRTDFDRRRRAHYGDVDLADLTEKRLGRNRRQLTDDPPRSPEEWKVVVELVASYVAKIRKRGGDVVFVHYPTAGRYTSLLEEHFPRAQYWDVMAQAVGGLFLHYRDVPGASELHCPDESHLDEEGAVFFTRAIGRAMVEHGLLDARR